MTRGSREKMSVAIRCRRERFQKLKRQLVVLSSLALIFVPQASSSKTQVPKLLHDLNEPEILQIRHRLLDNVKKLSLLRKDSEMLTASMDAAHAENRYLIRRFASNVASAEGAYIYVADILQRLCLTQVDKVSYYCYLKAHSTVRMRALAAECLKDIQEMNCHISSHSALHVIHKAIGLMEESVGLLDKTVEIIQHCNSPKPAPRHTTYH